jgi:hypothetical protein
VIQKEEYEENDVECEQTERKREKRRLQSVPHQYESRARDHSDKNSILFLVRPIPIFLTPQRSVSESEKSWNLLHCQNQEAVFPRVHCKLSVLKRSVAVLIYRIRIDI